MRESNWQKELAQGFSSAEALLKHLQLPVSLASVNAEKQFKTRVPRGFVDRMLPKNPNDPLLLQVLASHQELLMGEGFTSDPLAEKQVNPRPGLIHKYHGRVLLIMAGTCAVNCRYCFRRHFAYHENNPGSKGWEPVLDYIAQDESIFEVILSGGEPLLLPDAPLAQLLTKLAAIPHLQTLRIHTRMPIVLPERIDSSFLTLLKANRLQKVMVLHSNHPQELNEAVKSACFSLREAGCHLLNQSVILAGINDNATILAKLSRQLFQYGVLPYYLHMLDKVQGAMHFEVTLSNTQLLFKSLQSLLPGYLVPKLVREVPGEAHKVLYSGE